jgi:6-phosphogluconate dehydrogenase
MEYNIGVIGLGVMGQNLVLNIERNGYRVAAFDLDPEKRKSVQTQCTGRNIQIADSIPALLGQLELPRKVLLMVPAGVSVDRAMADLLPHLSQGDVLIDGGNTLFHDTERRLKEVSASAIRFMGMGISGGEEGALRGPSMMPGGDPAAWPVVKSIFQTIAAKTEEGIPCCDWVGNGGAGHFVKMIHNGIEYGDMQMICEAYHIMHQALGLSPADMKDIFQHWNTGELNSYLVEITAQIMGKQDDQSGVPIIDIILDTAGQKGTGKWTSQTALDLGVPAPTIAEAVFARTLSAIKEERVYASGILRGPEHTFSGDRDDMVEQIRQALYASKICSYAQGFHLMRSADSEYGWKLNFGNIALLWRAGCIIRAGFLDKIKQAFETNPTLHNLLLDPYFREAIHRNQKAWRNVISMAVEQGIPVPAFSSALAYYDSYRSQRLPANLLQAQRDYFGAHTYERIDKPRGEFFHTNWTDGISKKASGS